MEVAGAFEAGRNRSRIDRMLALFYERPCLDLVRLRSD
jgi:hypothetical protein